MDAYQREDDDRDFEHESHAEDEGRHEGEVLGRAELVLDHLAAEVDEELERARQQRVIAEEHSDHEQQEDERAGRQGEASLVRVQRGVDVGVDLVQDHGHRERDAAEQRDAHVGGEVLGGGQRYEAVDARWDQQDLDDVGREEERDRGRRDHGDRSHHQTVAQLAEMLDERQFFIAFGHRTSR